MLVTSTPKTIDALMARVDAIAGLTLGSLATKFDVAVPHNLKREKGWIGQLLERALGTDAGVRAQPDFTHLGIELKTIPVNGQGVPQESTYITMVPLLGAPGLCWENSDLYRKLKTVLWIPIEAVVNKEIAQRRMGQGFLWTMHGYMESVLRQDFEELMEMALLGRLHEISGRMGRYLHIRPKAADHRALTLGLSSEGEKIPTLPRGFYLRAQFTKMLIQQHLNVQK